MIAPGNLHDVMMASELLTAAGTRPGSRKQANNSDQQRISAEKIRAARHIKGLGLRETRKQGIPALK